MNEMQIIEISIRNSISVKEKFLRNIESVETMSRIIKEIVLRIKKGGIIYFIGNGGSAADAAHLSAELMGKFYQKRPPIKSFSLASNVALLTEIPNDFSFMELFERQVEALVSEKDILIGISTSGESENVLRALKKSKEKNAYTVGFTGCNKVRMEQFCDEILRVDSNDTPRIQEVHMLLGHIICESIEKSLFGGNKNDGV